MAETTLKHPREEAQVEEEVEWKRYKFCKDEEEPNTVLQVLSSDTICNQLPEPAASEADNVPKNCVVVETVKENADMDDNERILKHLLEASDDELGIPQREMGTDEEGDGGMNGEEGGFSLFDGLWEFEYEPAGYCTLLL